MLHPNRSQIVHIKSLASLLFSVEVKFCGYPTHLKSEQITRLSISSRNSDAEVTHQPHSVHEKNARAKNTERFSPLSWTKSTLHQR